jgi:hypothetical protein
MKKTNGNLIEWLTDSRSAEYFGRAFAIRADVLVRLINGTGSLAEIGGKDKVSRQAIHKHFKKARTIYCELSTAG